MKDIKKAMKDVKKGQKYIVVCTAPVSRSKVGLGSSGRFKEGEYITHRGTPTSDPNDIRRPAQVYTRGKEDFPFDFTFEKCRMTDFFEAIPVEVTIHTLAGW